ncbi:hypothetical protein CEXT_171221 [Caerostris extrusa]|uniref:Uncharacterized protein n=1 Tax=Caerostris extrusa TaxID=172846 RepID=A0AAV4YFG6_CAEEX|nr:hypothetical protein CEXT_171221 [Caerostris extrusa]
MTGVITAKPPSRRLFGRHKLKLETSQQLRGWWGGDFRIRYVSGVPRCYWRQAISLQGVPEPSLFLDILSARQNECSNSENNCLDRDRNTSPSLAICSAAILFSNSSGDFLSVFAENKKLSLRDWENGFCFLFFPQ